MCTNSFPSWWGGINSTDTNSITEHFNVLWKANWTRDAEKILKAFEKDVIMKVAPMIMKTKNNDIRILLNDL